MYYSGLRVEEIAERLGRSRADVYLLIRRAKESVRRCLKTLELYSSIRGFIEVEIGDGEDVLRAVERVIRTADSHRVKLSESSAKILISLLETAETCKALDRLRLSKPMKAMILRDGEVRFECLSQ